MSITARTITARTITARSIIARTIQVYSDFIQYCRYVSNFNGTTSYVEFDNDIVLSADFEVELYIRSSNVAGDETEIYLGSSSSVNPVMNYESNGNIRMRTNSVSVVQGATSPILDNLCVFKRASGTGTIEVSGSSVASGSLSGAITLNTIATYAGGLFFEGVIANVKIWTGGDRDTGTLLVDLPMTETSETSTVNYVNRTGNTDYNATGYNITVTEECEGDASAWNDGENWIDGEPWID